MEKIKNIPVLYKGIITSLIITVLFTGGFITGAMTAKLREEPLNVNVFLPAKQVAATEATTTTVPTTAAPTTAVPTTAAPETTEATTTEPTTTAPAEETEDEPCCIIGCLTKIIEFIKSILDGILSLLSSL